MCTGFLCGGRVLAPGTQGRRLSISISSGLGLQRLGSEGVEMGRRLSALGSPRAFRGSADMIRETSENTSQDDMPSNPHREADFQV